MPDRQNTTGKIVKCRAWLDKNKVFFETIAATLLSVMAIVVATVECFTAIKQTDLTSLQTDIARRQWILEVQRTSVQKSADWQKLRDCMWEIFDLYPRQGVNALEKLPAEAKAAWFHKMRSLLDSQTSNPVLIENKTCLGCWRNAITGAKTTADLFTSVDMTSLTNFCSIHAASVLKDVGIVWKRVVLDSDEVSPVGGRPPDAESADGARP